jgi:hypothetical protein
MRLDKAAMVRALHDQPKFSELFMSHLLARNVRVEADLVDQLFNSSEKRLARLLLLMANFGKEGMPQPVIAKVSQETLAEMIGTTRSRVSFFMNKFRKLGFVDYNGGNGGLEVHSSLLNMVLHETPGITPEQKLKMLLPVVVPFALWQGAKELCHVIEDGVLSRPSEMQFEAFLFSFV